jgi:hypothetical protein
LSDGHHTAPNTIACWPSFSKVTKSLAELSEDDVSEEYTMMTSI